MAGSVSQLALIPSNAVENSTTTTTRDQWEINFARFVPYPTTTTTTTTSSTTSSTSSDLLPLPPRIRNSLPQGNWISSTSVAFLRLLPNPSFSDVILTVSFNASIIEEHYVSKLHFSWPQVSCVSGFPPRGIRTVLVSFRDSVGQIQKFAMRFPSIYETHSFINVLKVILNVEKGPEPLNADFGSEISSVSEFTSSNKQTQRPCEEPSFMTPLDTYIPQMPQSMKNEREQPSGIQERDTPPGFNSESNLPALPPSFASLLMNCSEINHVQQTVSQENELKSQIVRYMEDSSFQDMLVKVERVISELGGDMSL